MRLTFEKETDIIITDPCYIDNNKNELWNTVDIFDRGKGLEKYGFTKWIWEPTLIGDWFCNVYKVDNKNILNEFKKEEKLKQYCKNKIGGFSADAGLVGVFILDEVLKFNSNYKDYIENKTLVTLIENFKGTVEYKIIEDEPYIIGKGNVNFVSVLKF